MTQIYITANPHQKIGKVKVKAFPAKTALVGGLTSMEPHGVKRTELATPFRLKLATEILKLQGDKIELPMAQSKMSQQNAALVTKPQEG